MVTLFGRSRQSLPGWVGIRRNLNVFRFKLSATKDFHLCTHENDDKPGLNKSRHGLGDVVTEHIGASPDVPLEVADGVTLVAHLKLRSAILDPGLFCFDCQI